MITILLIGILLTLVACSPAAPPTTPAPHETTPTPTTLAPHETTPTPTPPPTQSPAGELSLKIVSVTSPVSPGANATLVAQTIPEAECDITVYYKSGPSTASGLYPKTADSSGRVSWTWKVGTRTTPGSWQIVVKASYGGKTVSQTTEFTVR